MTTINIDKLLLEQVQDLLYRVTRWKGESHEVLTDLHDIKEAVKAVLAAPASAPEPVAWMSPKRFYRTRAMALINGEQLIEPLYLYPPATAPEPSTEVAVGKLCKSLREDLDYAWAWHCNIAMAAFDAGCPHDVANEGAARFMQLLAGVDTREHPAFQGTQDHPMRNDKTAPAQPAPERKPMTEELIEVLYGDSNFDVVAPSVIAFARAVEAFHGIKEQP
jgi:hypothetical protein